MFDFGIINSKHIKRNIDISIALHNSNRTLQDVADEYGVTKERVRQIHGRMCRYLHHWFPDLSFYDYSKNGHTEEKLKILKEYKEFLISKGRYYDELPKRNSK